jgi:hypothetical protein
VEDRRAAMEMTNLAILAATLRDRQLMGEVTKWCRTEHPPFPAGGGAMFLWRTAWAAGIHIPYTTKPVEMVSLLQQVGWDVIPANAKAQGGDLAVFVEGGRMFLEWVVKASPDGKTFSALDALNVSAFVDDPEGRAETRVVTLQPLDTPSVDPGGRKLRYVIYYLRFHCEECALAKKRRQEQEAAAAAQASLQEGNEE